MKRDTLTTYLSLAMSGITLEKKQAEEIAAYFDAANEQLAKANERVKELEKQFETQMTNDFVTITDQAKRIAELEKYNLALANESHKKSLAIDRANERVEKMELALDSLAVFLADKKQIRHRAAD